MSLFEFSDYRAFLKEHIYSLPKHGRGELSKLSRHLGVNSTLISQIMAGLRDFTTEQAYDITVYLGLSELEAEYFTLLVQIEKAGNSRLKGFLRKRLAAVKAESFKLEKRFAHDKKLSEEDKTIFYSSWLYSAIRLFCSTREEGRTVEEITGWLQISNARALECLRFLTRTGLCTQKGGHYQMGVPLTFVAQGSPHLLKHHANWRLKALQRSEGLSAEELMITAPMSISAADFQAIREMLTTLMSSLSQKIKDSPAEEVACLNMDFFRVER